MRNLKWNTYDLVIVAIGKPGVELYLNETANNTMGTPPVLFTWLEPYDIGGHAILTNSGDEPGCLECLFTPDGEEQPSLGNKIHFSVLGQQFGKDISGCGQLFTPYGSLSALRTAEVATKLAIETLIGTIEGNPYVSWKGNPKTFLEKGFQLTENHEKSQDELLNPSYDHVVAHCPTCGSKTKE